VKKNGTLTYLLTDQLGSTSVAVNTSGTKTSEVRYKPWGEVRYAWNLAPTGGLPTDYTFTGQKSYMDDPTTTNTEGFGLMYYNARWYDPALGRFISPDSIVPSSTQGVQALDRYAYANNAPTRYTDPSGHGILEFAVAIVAGALLGTAIYTHAIHQPSKPADANASTFKELLALGYEHAEHANVTGDALQSIQDDPSVQRAQQKTVDFIANNSKYGKESFSPELSPSEPFTADGPSGDWVQAATEGNQAFWVVHSGSVSADDVTVSADGTISATWHIQDDFDFIPGPDHSVPYNIIASIVNPLYSGLFGAKKSYRIDVHWKQTYPPQKKKSTP
jgi:RHS repeat-associated protein